MLHIFSLEKGLVLLTPDYLAVPVGDLVIAWVGGRTTIKHAATDEVIHAEGAAQEEEA
jgi:hypothetical protein